MKNRGFIFGVLFVLVCWVAMASTNLHQYTTQEALNKLIGAKPHEYTTQQALNVIATKPACRDTVITLFTWVFDDGLNDVWMWADSFTTYNQVATSAVITFDALHGDTSFASTADSMNYLSKWKLQALENRGWGMIGHGWAAANGPDSDYPDLWSAYAAADTDRAMCRGEVWEYELLTDAQRTYAAFDTLGLTPPRGWSCPNNSTSQAYKRALSRAGFDYGFAPSNTASGPGKRQNWLKEVQGYHASEFPDVAAYINCLPPRYEILQNSGEAATFSDFRTEVLEAIELKGSWFTYIGHTPDIWVENKYGGHGNGFEFEQALSFIDSLQTLGLIRVVTTDEAYELMYETPVCEGANLLWNNWQNMDGDTVLAQMDWTRHNIHPFADSVFVDIDRPDHGVFGTGYATLSWGTAPTLLDFKGANCNAMINQRDCTWILPNFARGMGVEFEIWAQVDQSIEDVAGTPLSTADTLAVTMIAYKARAWNRPSTSVTGIGPMMAVSPNAGGGTAIYAAWMSYSYLNTNSLPTNFSTFNAADTVGGNWLHVTATWRVPYDADFIEINVCKDSRFDAQSVRISNPSLSIFERSRNRW